MLAALRLQVGTSSSNHIEITLLTEHCCDITETSCYMQKNIAEAVTSQLELLVHGGIAEKHADHVVMKSGCEIDKEQSPLLGESIIRTIGSY